MVQYVGILDHQFGMWIYFMSSAMEVVMVLWIPIEKTSREFITSMDNLIILFVDRKKAYVVNDFSFANGTSVGPLMMFLHVHYIIVDIAAKILGSGGTMIQGDYESREMIFSDGEG